MSSPDFYFKVYWIIYTVLGCSFQLLLISLIHRKSPANLDNLKRFLYNTTIAQLALIACAFSLQYRNLSNSSSFAILSYGPCRLIGQGFCFASYHLFQASSMACGSSVMITVMFRYLVLLLNELTKLHINIMIATVYIAPIVLVVLPFTDTWNFELVQSLTVQEHPTYNLSAYFPYSGFSDISSARFMTATLILTIAAYGVPLCCVILTRKVLTLINCHQNMSEKTKKQAKTLIYGLVVQSILPVVSYIPSFSSWIYTQTTGVELIISEYMIHVLAALPGLCDPLITFYFVVPYRQAILEFMGQKCQKHRMIPLFRITNHSVSATN